MSLSEFSNPRAFSTVANAVAHAEFAANRVGEPRQVSAIGHDFQVHKPGEAHPGALVLATVTPERASECQTCNGEPHPHGGPDCPECGRY